MTGKWPQPRLPVDAMDVQWGKIRAGDILEPVHGALSLGEAETRFSGLSTDSRDIRPGALFVALRGERFDGHAFAASALEHGAAGLMVEKEYLARFLADKQRDPAARPALIAVRDTLRALGDLAAWWRQQHPAEIVAVTGSAGKTTTKEMAALIFDRAKPTLKNRGNLNNLIGLPLTLLQLNPEHRYGVLEMGMNRFGEIARLTDIADPDVGLITNVGRAHTEGVGGLLGVARAKTEMVDRMAPGGRILINGDDDLLVQTARTLRGDLLTFGLGPGNDFTAEKVRNLGRDGWVFDLKHPGNTLTIRLTAPGAQHVMNALAAAAAARCLHVPHEAIVEGLKRFSGIKGRLTVTALKGGITLVDDTYNANPESLKAALQALPGLLEKGGRMIVGLGDMLELGRDAARAHRQAGRLVAETGAHLFLALGEEAGEMVEGALEGGMTKGQARIVESHEDMAAQIRAAMAPGGLVLVKGSRKMTLEKVVEGLIHRP